MMRTLFASVVLLVGLIAHQADADVLSFQYVVDGQVGPVASDWGLLIADYDENLFDDNVNTANVAWFGTPMYSGSDSDPSGWIDPQAAQWNFIMKYEPGLGVSGNATEGYIWPAADGTNTVNFVNDENGQFAIFTDPEGFANKIPLQYEAVQWIPEPSSAALGLMGLLGVVGMARRRVRR